MHNTLHATRLVLHVSQATRLFLKQPTKTRLRIIVRPRPIVVRLYEKSELDGYGDGFTAPGANRDVYDRYVAELKKENRPTDDIRFASGFWCLIVSNDPEKTFAEAADHITYQANNYSAWLSMAGLNPLSEYLRDREQLRQSGLLQVVDPDTAISIIRDFANNAPITHFYSWTVPPGPPPQWAQTHLELFASKVIPAFR
jgi:hypothetical protein